jgi:hypothetical protein
MQFFREVLKSTSRFSFSQAVLLVGCHAQGNETYGAIDADSGVDSVRRIARRLIRRRSFCRASGDASFSRCGLSTPRTRITPPWLTLEPKLKNQKLKVET